MLGYRRSHHRSGLPARGRGGSEGDGEPEEETATAQSTTRRVLPPEHTCECKHALETALVTALSDVPE